MPRGWHNSHARRFSRQWWSETLRTLVWVAAITILIWIYADMEFTREQEFRFTIRLTTGSSEAMVILSDRKVLPRRDEDVVLKAAGSSTGLDQFERKLKARGGIVEYDVSGLKPGAVVLSTEDIVAHTLNPQREGLAISAVTPPTITLTLDERITVPDVPVTFVYTGAELASPAVPVPDKVSIRVAHTLWDQIKDKKPTLKTVPLDLQKVDTSRELTVDLAQTIEDIPVLPDPSQVSVKVQVKELTQEQSLKVSVQVLMPPSWLEDGTWRRFDLVRKEPAEWSQLEITVSGAKEELAKLRPDQIDAYVVLNDTDKKPLGSWLNRDVTVRLPEGLKLRLVGQRPKLSFRLDPVSTP